MMYKTSDVFELAQDINCPGFTRRLEKGEIRTGGWVKQNFNLLWINRNDVKEFNKWFTLSEKYETKNCRIVEKR